MFNIGFGVVPWSLNKQLIITLSTTEAEFLAASSCACQGVWLRNMLTHLKIPQKQSSIICCDKSSSIKLSKNPIMHGRCKNINVRFYFLKNLINDGVIVLKYCNTHEQLEDILTKLLKLESFVKLRDGLGIKEISCIT